MKKWWGECCILFLAIVLIAFYSVYIGGFSKGYKEGQIDYALNRIEYTVIEGKVIHIEEKGK